MYRTKVKMLKIGPNKNVYTIINFYKLIHYFVAIAVIHKRAFLT